MHGPAFAMARSSQAIRPKDGLIKSLVKGINIEAAIDQGDVIGKEGEKEPPNRSRVA